MKISLFIDHFGWPGGPSRSGTLRQVFAQEVYRVQGEIEALRKEDVSCPHPEA